MQVAFQKPDLKKLRKQGLTYVDMHVHTSETDSSTKLFLLIKKAQLLKMGLAITDHNNINSVIKAQKYKKVLIIPGIELTSFDYMDLLLYFYNLSELKEFYTKYVQNNKRPNRGFDFMRLKFPMKELLDITKKYNCITSLAHPFAPYPQTSFYYFNDSKNKRLLKKIDAIEVLNGLFRRYRNTRAMKWAESLKKAYTGGSDTHTLFNLGKVLTVSDAGTTETFLNAIKKKKNTVIGEETRGLSKLYSNLVIFKNCFRIRLKEEVEEIKEDIKEVKKDIKEDITKTKTKVKKLKKKIKKGIKEDITKTKAKVKKLGKKFKKL